MGHEQKSAKTFDSYLVEKYMSYNKRLDVINERNLKQRKGEMLPQECNLHQGINSRNLQNERHFSLSLTVMLHFNQHRISAREAY